ncbi:glycoside hydrolase family 3 N-terminal domain-containing protein [Sinomicrobium weinanense]|uniref:Glycoside hydrolase family 3 C-terminal domain-containing protein n=1 Tax=Sinomicrobium weinanense TaxID=2842200 RepID=A0A926JSR9_9FLAO|nr:glycoside hydrolase family 3 N-terminal domain-containing protein [Sinomicrobium weinanense]MBC9796845.1 glycoside hydrolase family 3 C-terminal domain-containing protein [Sinomicrobium weinanense]MBU3125218.1 glycoside hydrolase family 3 C-terminal domain-containing protein [Sinomicrobium weinanense]
MKTLRYAIGIIFFVTYIPSFAQKANTSAPLYKDSTSPVSLRIKDLLERMTPEEKAGQLSTLLGWEMYSKKGDKVTESKTFRQAIQEQHIGMLWATLRADPWTRKTLKTGLSPRQAAEATNALQKYAVENTRLGIPLLLSEECPHGHMAIGTTVFPTSIGQGSTWHPELIKKMAGAIAREARLQGGHIGYGPVLDLAREPRWSRVEETYGEDPVLNSEMGEAMVRGFQGNNLKSGYNIASTLKHFAAYGVPEGGHNGNAVHVGKRELRQSYLPPFKNAVKAGARSVMTAYSSVDGVPGTANHWLLNNLLRGEWDFNGFVVSDLGSIEGLMGDHHIAASPEQAASLAITAGVDADLGGKGFGKALLEALRSGEVPENVLDTAVSRVLRLKFEMGLFEDPYVDPEKAEKEVRNKQHTALARQVARESVTLLKNQDNLLPLSKDLENIAVIGPNADNIYNQLGDYTAPQPEDNITTVLEGIRNKVSSSAKVTYVKGCAIRDTIQTDIPGAVRAAAQADVTVVVLGGSSARDFKTKYIETGAATVDPDAKPDVVSDMESGEGYDRSTLDLMGKQMELLRAVVNTGTPTVLVLIKGRPLLLNWPSENVPAILDAWYPGQEGGNAIADVLFGDYNPAGRLPISVPESVGQLPVYYNTLFPEEHNYVEGDATPLYSFGHGLSYTDFKYDKPEVKVEENEHDFTVYARFRLTNTGARPGDEVVQLYLRDEVSSVVSPKKQLKAFRRIHLKAGEEKTLEFQLKPEDLMLWNTRGKWVAEAGKFILMIGASSEDIRLNTNFKISRNIEIHNP